MSTTLSRYLETLAALTRSVACTGGDGAPLPADAGFARSVGLLVAGTSAGHAVIWVGNGGSAAIASHITVDFFKAGARSVSFNDGPMLTCMGNDYGYDQVFAKPIEFCAHPGDVLMAISSSGRSANILNAVAAARARGAAVVTLSGFDAANPLRSVGDYNFYVASSAYGFVETVHAAICHALYDAWAERVHGYRFRIDDHKLLHHLPRVAAWQLGELIYPIYAEVSPSGSCNHRCLFCALDYMEYQPRFLDAELLAQRLAEMASLGVKSVLFGGEGEPLLNRGFARMAAAGRAAGLDLALTTNGVLLRGELLAATVATMQWVKVSFNAGSRDTYAAVHRTRPEDFDAVVANLEAAVRLRERTGAACTLGAQLLLLPENRAEVAAAARLCRDIGLDYLVIKPYSQHRFSRTDRYRDIRYAEYLQEVEAAAAYATDRFSVIARQRTMAAWDEGARPYARCLALPFWSYVDAGGNVWGCSAWLGDERFRYGNLTSQTFREIWEGELRRASLAFVAQTLDVNECRLNCRMDKINRFLWEASRPLEHVNFI